MLSVCEEEAEDVSLEAFDFFFWTPFALEFVVVVLDGCVWVCET